MKISTDGNAPHNNWAWKLHSLGHWETNFVDLRVVRLRQMLLAEGRFLVPFLADECRRGPTYIYVMPYFTSQLLWKFCFWKEDS